MVTRTPRTRANPLRAGTCGGRRARDPRSCQAGRGRDTRAWPSPRGVPRGTADSFPQAPVLYLGEVDFKLARTGWTCHDPHRLSVGVDPFVEALEVVEVGREQALDQIGGDLGEFPDPRDRARQQQHGEVRLVLAYLHRP